MIITQKLKDFLAFVLIIYVNLVIIFRKHIIGVLKNIQILSTYT